MPYSQPGARIAFDRVLGIWVLLEVRVRLSSHFNRQGTRVDRGSLWVLVALVYVLDGLGEPYRRFAAGRPRLFPGLW